MTTSRTRWGILGTGWVAHEFTSDLLRNGFHVTAVGSRSQSSANAFATEFGIGTAHDSYAALAADDNVDAIYVSTPHPFHWPHARLGLEAGKHVLLEKPFTVNAREAHDLVAFAAQQNLLIMEAMWTRFVPHMVRVREIIAAGTIGEVRTLIADHNQALPTDPHHRVNDLNLGGGALLDLGVYPVSFAEELFGTPLVVHALAAKTGTGVDRQTGIMLGYAGGQQAILQCALDTNGPNTATIMGTKGWIAIDTVWHDASSFTLYQGEDNVIERFEFQVPGRGMHYQAEEFERLIERGATVSTIMSPESSISVMDTLDEIRRQIDLSYPSDSPVEH
ncbi:MAG: Gfo/Idh/MocA family oxidoreductase [Lacisediminihabitans sp.]